MTTPTQHDFKTKLLDAAQNVFRTKGYAASTVDDIGAAGGVACDKGMSSHVANLTREIDAAKQRYAPDAPWSAESVGYFIQAVLQGSFIFAKAKEGSEVARENLSHLGRYLEGLLPQPRKSKPKEKR